MTSPHFFASAAGLPLGWSVVPPPLATVPAQGAKATRTALPPSLPPQPLPPSPSQALVLANAPAIAHFAIPRRYPTQKNNHPYLQPSCLPLQSSSNETYPSAPRMSATAEDIPKKKARHRSHRRSASAHVAAHVRYVPAPQMIPPAPPPQSLAPASIPSIPAIPFDAQTRTGSPFMVYHVCGVCHQPRSKSYHQRHPVRDGDAMPTPSICHRCKGAKEDKYEEVRITHAREKESDVTPRIRRAAADEQSLPSKVSKDDYVSEWMDRYNVPSSDRNEAKKQPHYPRPRESYTQVKTTIYLNHDHPSSVPTAEQTLPLPVHPVHPVPRSIYYRYVDAPRRIEDEGEIETAAPTQAPELELSSRAAFAAAHVGAWMPPSIPPQSAHPSSRATSLTSSKVRQIAQEEIRRTALTPPAAQAVAAPPSAREPSMTASEVRRIAGDKARPLATTSPLPSSAASRSAKSASVTPSEVRRIARDEIQSYRGAERLVEAHSHPYSHGYAETIASPSHELTPDTSRSMLNHHDTSHAVVEGAPQAASSAHGAQSQSAASRADFGASIAASTKDDSNVEYFYFSRKAEVLPSAAPSASQAKSIPGSDVEHVVVEKDLYAEYVDATHESRYRDEQVYYDAASTVDPSSSISQRPSKEAIASKEGRLSSYRAKRTGETDYSSTLYNIQEDARHASKDVNIGRFSEIRRDAAYDDIVRPSAPPAVSKQNRVYRTSEQSAMSEPGVMEDNELQYTRCVPVEASSGNGRSGSKHESAPLEQHHETIRFRHVQAGGDALAAPRPIVGSDRDSGDMTVWPGHEPAIRTHRDRTPLDSVALHQEQADVHHPELEQALPLRPRYDQSYLVPRGSVRRPLSPPADEDIVREDRRVYREMISPGRERTVKERIIRMARRSPDWNGDEYRGRPSSRFNDLPPKSILRPPSIPPGEGIYAGSRARVSFASREQVAPGPPYAPSSENSEPYIEGMSRVRRRPRGHELDGPNSSQTSSDEYYYERERGRTAHRYPEEDDGLPPYEPEMKRIPTRPLTRALSESPSRERAEELKRKAGKKRVMVEVESEAHGPFRAEISPTPSMEVMTSGSRVSVDSPEAQAAGKTKNTDRDVTPTGNLPRVGKPSISTRRHEPHQSGWLKVTKVKQYISHDGIPYEVVEEDYIWEDELAARQSQLPRGVDLRDSRLD